MNETKIISAAIILNKEKSKILLIKRRDSMWGDCWSIPGGHVEFNETIKEALLRELTEELNINILNAEFLTYEEFFSPTNRYKKFISFNFIVSAEKDIKLNKEEIKEATWFSFGELKKISHKIPREGISYINGLMDLS